MIKNNLLKSKIIKITGIKEKDINTITNWYEDTNFLRMFDYKPSFPMNKEKIKKWIEEENNKENNYFFAIRNNENEELIGYVEIEKIIWNNRVGNIALGFGNEKYRGKGYGEEALSLVIDFAFRELNLHRIQLITISYNYVAIKLYEKLGFKREGIFREAILRDGEKYDLYEYGLLKNEWKRNI